MIEAVFTLFLIQTLLVVLIVPACVIQWIGTKLAETWNIESEWFETDGGDYD